MSNRTQDQGLIDLIRSLVSRITKLETQFSSVKRNDIRIGDLVVSSDREYDRIKLKNLITGNTKFLGDPRDAEFSYSGLLVVNGDETDISPEYVMPVTSNANAIVLSQRVSAGDITVDVVFNETYTKRVTILNGQTLRIEGINVPVGINTKIYVKLIDVPEGARDLSVFVRFGGGTTQPRTDV